jgi:hypothetical protein
LAAASAFLRFISSIYSFLSLSSLCYGSSNLDVDSIPIGFFRPPIFDPIFDPISDLP